jgi:hypothetical protein
MAMIKVRWTKPGFYTAYANARNALPCHPTCEPPRYYARRWFDTYGCQLIKGGQEVVFDSEQDYMWFLLKWK